MRQCRRCADWAGADAARGPSNCSATLDYRTECKAMQLLLFIELYWKCIWHSH